jgi:hypothetical protein
MGLVRLSTVVEQDGEITLAGLPFRKGQRVEATARSETAESGAPQRTARSLLQSPLGGLWKDREEIEDSVHYARRLREHAQKRQGSEALIVTGPQPLEDVQQALCHFP